VEATPSDDDRRRRADRRDDDADAREAEADQRELGMDARERVLDRWEAEIAARAASLQILDEDEEADRQRASALRAQERERRRGDADARRDAAIERGIQREGRERRIDRDRRSDDPVAGGGEITQLATALQANLPLDEVLDLILAAGVATVPGCAAVSVALTAEGRLQTVASTAPWAAELDAVQVEVACGPVVSAAAVAGVVTSVDLSAEECWPRSPTTPDSNAVRGVISFGLVLGGSGPAVLTLYSDRHGEFGRSALRIGDMLAAHAAGALTRTLERLTIQAQTDAWQRALGSRDLIGQAKGILMEQRSIDAQEAFNLLRQTSQQLNVKLRDVAARLVERRQLPDS
jgi:hypothetical protein